MGVDFESFSGVLKHPIRRKIVLALNSNKSLSYMDLLNTVQVANTGKFNYHLKLLGDLIEKDTSGKYFLTEKGQLAAQFLQKFPEKKTQPTTLHMADATLIGLAGFALIAANPSLWVGLWLDSHKITVPMLALPVFGWVSTFYGLFVPGAVMWLLSVRRAHSHEMYSLLRAPLVAFIILLPLTIIMIIMKVPVVAEIKAPLIIINHGTRQILTVVSLVGIFLQGLGFSFLGVSIIELASRIRKRLRT